jgi:hypothetical protein
MMDVDPAPERIHALFSLCAVKGVFDSRPWVSALNVKNPCDAAALLKTFKTVRFRPLTIPDKETEREITYGSRPQGSAHTGASARHRLSTRNSSSGNRRPEKCRGGLYARKLW